MLQQFPLPIVWVPQLEKAYQQAVALLQKLTDFYKNHVLSFNNMLLMKALIPEQNSQRPINSILVQFKSNLKSLDKISEFTNALQLGLNLIESETLNFSTLLKIHNLLLNDSKNIEKIQVGTTRQHSVHIVRGKRIIDTKPLSEDVPKLMRRFDDLFQSQHDNPLILLGICQHLFLSIHPFSDGNGRISIIMISLYLVSRHIIPKEIAIIFALYLYAFFHSTSQINSHLIASAKYTLDLNQWLVYFLDTISLSANELINKTHIFQEKIIEQSQFAKTPLQKMIVQQHFQFPYFSVNQISELLDCSSSSARKAIKDLESKEILSYLFTYQKNKMYANQEIIRVLSEKIYIRL